jgi:hypothetical protein
VIHTTDNIQRKSEEVYVEFLFLSLSYIKTITQKQLKENTTGAK